MSQEKKRLRKTIHRFLTPKARYVRQTINGHPMILDLDDPWLRTNFLWCKIYEPETTAYIKQHVKPNDVVLDIGAHIGYHSLNFWKNGATVYAYEPDPRATRLFLRNTEHTDIILFQRVVSDVRGQTILYRSRGGSAWNSIHPIRDAKPFRVQSVRIDDNIFGSVDWIKVDVEGAELKALQGMRETLRQSPNVRLLVEWLPKNKGDLEGVLKFFDGWNCRPLDHNMLFWRQNNECYCSDIESY